MSSFCVLCLRKTLEEWKIWPVTDISSPSPLLINTDTALLPVLALSLPSLPHTVCPLEFCAHVALWVLWEIGVVKKKMGTHVAHMSSAHVYAPLSLRTSLTKHKFKIKLLRISSRELNQVLGPMRLHRSHTLKSAVCLHKVLLCLSHYTLFGTLAGLLSKQLSHGSFYHLHLWWSLLDSS